MGVSKIPPNIPPTYLNVGACLGTLMNVISANITDFIRIFKQIWTFADGVLVPVAGLEPAT